MERRSIILGKLFILLLIWGIFTQISFAQHFTASKVGTLFNGKEKKIKDTTSSNKQDEWFAPDKAKHFLAGTFSTVFFHQYYKKVRKFSNKKSLNYSISFSITISVGKELFDAHSSQNHFCKKDLLYDGLGILAGLILVNQR